MITRTSFSLGPVITPLLPLLFLTVIISDASGQQLSYYQSLGGYRFYKDATEIPKSEFKSLMAEEPAAWALWRKSNVNYGIGAGLAISGSALLVWGLVEDSNGTRDPAALYWSSLGTLIASAVFSIISIDQRREAVLTYNRAYLNSSVIPHNSPSQAISVAWPIGN